MRAFGVLVLWLAGLGYLAFGVGFLIAPVELARMAELSVASPAAVPELRAFYGGLEIALALLILAAALRPARRADGLLLSFATYLGIGGTRLASMLATGVSSDFLTMAVGVELGLGFASLLAWRAAARPA